MNWEVGKAAQAAARREIAATLPPCPNCGASVDPESIGLLDISSFHDRVPQFLHDVLKPYECSARCWEKDPDKYIAAVKAAQS